MNKRQLQYAKKWFKIFYQAWEEKGVPATEDDTAATIAYADILSLLDAAEMREANKLELCPICLGMRVFGHVIGGTNPEVCYACGGKGFVALDAVTPDLKSELPTLDAVRIIKHA